MLIPGQEILPAAIMAGAVLLVGGAVVWQYFAEKKRREDLAAAALRLGLEYRADDPGLARETFSGFPLFCQGRNRQFSNVLRGRLDADAEVLVFDHSYVTGSGKNRPPCRQTAAA